MEPYLVFFMQKSAKTPNPIINHFIYIELIKNLGRFYYFESETSVKSFHMN